MGMAPATCYARRLGRKGLCLLAIALMAWMGFFRGGGIWVQTKGICRRPSRLYFELTASNVLECSSGIRGKRV